MIIKIGVNGMSCGHCSKAVADAIKQIAGVEDVVVDLQEKIAVINTKVAIAEDLLSDIIEDEGYEFLGIL